MKAVFSFFILFLLGSSTAAVLNLNKNAENTSVISERPTLLSRQIATVKIVVDTEWSPQYSRTAAVCIYCSGDGPKAEKCFMGSQGEQSLEWSFESNTYTNYFCTAYWSYNTSINNFPVHGGGVPRAIGNRWLLSLHGLIRTHDGTNPTNDFPRYWSGPFPQNRTSNRHEEGPRLSTKEGLFVLTLREVVDAIFALTGRILQEIILGVEREIIQDGTGPLNRAYQFARRRMEVERAGFYDVDNFDPMLHIAAWMYTYENHALRREDQLYAILNRELREIRTPEQVNAFRYPYTYALIHTALEELPQEAHHPGNGLDPNSLLYRGVSYIPQDLQIGRSYDFQMLTSTSRRRSVAQGFLENVDRGSVFEIHGLIRTAINWFSTDRHNDHDEAEILVVPFQCIVLSVHEREIDGRHDLIKVHSYLYSKVYSNLTISESKAKIAQ